MKIRIGNPKNVKSKKEEAITKKVFDRLDHFVGGGYGKSVSQIEVEEGNQAIIFNTMDANGVDISTLIYELKQDTSGLIEVI